MLPSLFQKQGSRRLLVDLFQWPEDDDFYNTYDLLRVPLPELYARCALVRLYLNPQAGKPSQYIHTPLGELFEAAARAKAAAAAAPGGVGGGSGTAAAAGAAPPRVTGELRRSVIVEYHRLKDMYREGRDIDRYGYFLMPYDMSCYI
jgi:hypothetical protein